MDIKIKLKSLNPYIICNICKGYLVDATAITECLHTFCKSCLIKHLEANTNCPTCNIVIHHSYPRQYINFDRTMQDIVYKLVPGLQANEIKREKEFYRIRGMPYPKDIVGEETKEEKSPDVPVPHVEEFGLEELINVCLECLNKNQKKIFIRVPVKTTILVIKKFIARKIYEQRVQFETVDIWCNGEQLEEEDSLKFIYLTKWKFDDVPLILQYKALVT